MNICLDPGHGVGNKGALDGDEDSLNLRVADYAYDMLDSGLDLCVCQTRYDDVDPGWDERKRLADNADLVISIHHNSFIDPSFCGMDLYHYPGNKKTDLACCRAAKYAPGKVSPVAIIPALSRNSEGAAFICGLYKPDTILVECCYLTNPGDFAYIKTKRYFERMGLFVANLALCYEDVVNEQMEE